MATKADIEIAVKGIQKLKEAKKEINKLNRAINDSNKDIVKEAKKKKVVDKANKTNVGAASQVRSINTLNKQLSTATRNFNRVALGTEDAAKAALQLKQAQDALNKAYADQNKLMGTNNQLSSSALQKQTDIARGKFAGSGPGVFGPQPKPSFAQSIGIKRGFDFQSAAISGAFPLLFGQGPVASIAGGVGGGVGGMFGGMGGFAGGIAATAAVQTVTNIVNGITKLGEALSTLDGSFNLLKEKSLFSSKEAATRAQVLQILGEREKLATLVSKELIQVLGEDGAKQLREAGEASKEVNKEFTKINLTLQIALAGPLKNILKFINTLIEQGNKVSLGEGKGTINLGPAEDKFITNFKQVLKTLNQDQLDRILRAPIGTNVEGLNITEGRKQAIRKFSLVKQVNPDSKLVGGLGTETGTAKDLLDIDAARVASAQKKINKMKEQITFAQQIKVLGIEEATRQKEIEAIMKNLTDEERKLLELGDLTVDQLFDKSKAAKEFEQNAKKINSVFEQLNVTIGNDIKNGIAGLIKGTSTLGDMLNNVANRFLDLALNQALFGDALGAGGKKGGGILGFLGFARGGRPPVGRPSIVGERGPELFVPRSSGTIVPNNKLGGGGSTSVVVNVDASGSDVQGDDSGAKELGALISVAVQGELVKQQRPGGLLSSIR